MLELIWVFKRALFTTLLNFKHFGLKLVKMYGVDSKSGVTHLKSEVPGLRLRTSSVILFIVNLPSIANIGHITIFALERLRQLQT